MKTIVYFVLILLVSITFSGCQRAGQTNPNEKIRICYANDAGFQEQLAAKELRRYLYLCTGKLHEIQAVSSVPNNDDLIVVAAKGSELLKDFTFDTEALKSQEYAIKTIDNNDRKVVIISGGDSTAVLYGAYHFIEKLGVRFHLHGDVIPDKKIDFVLPQLDEFHKPVFKLRGILPFHDFPEGPDWWDKDDYKSYFDQMVKMRMNFIGLHTYSSYAAEPHLWLGVPEDFKKDGTVTNAHPAEYANTLREGEWLYSALETKDFSGGAHLIFPKDAYSSDIQGKYLPRPTNMQESIEQINHTGAMLKDVFAYGKKAGVKLCFGNELPLWMPPNVIDRLKSMGLDPTSDEAVRKVYSGTFKWVREMYNPDYFWLWTNEAWTLYPVKKSDIDKVTNHMMIAADMLKKEMPDTRLATCGWTVGPPGDLTGFDRILPEGSSISSINRNVGFAPVESDFATIKRCDTWVIPWIEDDPAMVEPQLWAGRVRRDAFDAHKYGAKGFMGILWRTRILAPQLKALAEAGWSLPTEKEVEDTSNVDLPVRDLYTDWVKTEFGPDAPQALIDMFIKYDGGPRTRTRDQWFANLPRISNWNGPGAIFPQRKSWEMVVSKEFAFVGEMETMRSSITGLGALERYDYWLNTFRFQREMGHLSCLRGELDEIIESIESEKNSDSKQERVIQEALPLRIAIARSWEQMMAHMLQTVTNSSELGTIANLEMHTRKNTHFVSLHDSQLQQWLGFSLPAEARLSKKYTGTPHIIVPSKRTRANVGEHLHLKVIILDNNRVKEAKLYWRKLGDKDYQKIVLKHVARAVYKVSFPKFEEEKTIEYHVKAQTASGTELIWPATAPAINHSVIIMSE